MVERIVNVYGDLAGGILARRFWVNYIVLYILEKAAFLGLVQAYTCLGNQRMQATNFCARLDSRVLIPACAAPRNKYAEYVLLPYLV